MAKSWESYEAVAADLLSQFAHEFGLDTFEGKQHITGTRSGTEWEIDAKGVRSEDGGFMIVECRRYTTSRQNQERVGGLAYRIIDTGAIGGIMVSPLGLQEGAEKVAAAENVFDVRLDKDSTRHDFVIKFLGKFRIGASLGLSVCGSIAVEAEVVPAKGADGDIPKS
jgi:hypothetical protein